MQPALHRLLRRTGALPRIYGHRGARGVLPENTMAGFDYLRGLGADGVEIDVQNAAGRVPVVIHDPRVPMALARTPDGVWLTEPGPKVIDLGVAALQAYDIGRLNPATPYGTHHPDQRPADGARVPTLDAFLSWAAEGAPEVLNIEIKSYAHRDDLGDPPAVLVEDVLSAVHRHGLAGRVLISSFDWRVLTAVRAADPMIARGYLSAETSPSEGNVFDGSPWMDGLRLEDHGGSLPRLIAAQGGLVWCAWHRDLTAARVAEAQALGVAVNAWTVNTPEDIAAVIAQGVDGIITDLPALAQEIAAP
ncbi:MAG: hypothetical protein JJU42_12585 [Rhodobacteraceae bacterium]|nr:hypothetical protein [Paracoccaceae bacterium]